MAQDLRDLPPPNNHGYTYVASETVTVDDSTADFLDAAAEWLEEASAQRENIRRAKVDQALFAQGSRDFLAGKTDSELMDNSDAYFQGQDYGRRIHNDIAKVAKERFPAPSDTVRVKQFGDALLKKELEVEKI